MSSALPSSRQTSTQPAPPKMTLRRFVRVTFDNFRQLMQTIAAPTTSLPMPPITPPPITPPPARYPAPELAEHSARAALPPVDGLATGQAAAFQGLEVDGSAMDDGRREGSGQPERKQAELEQAELEQAELEQAELEQPALEQPGPEQSNATQAGAAAEHPGAQAAQSAGELMDESDVRSDPPQTDEPDEGETEADGGPASATATPEPESGEAAEGGALPLAAALESLLFVSDQAVEPAQLARVLNITPAEAEAALLTLDAAYRQAGRGLRVQVRNGRYQLVTAPEAATLIENFLNLDTSARLSAPALEALAVVAYRQPVTRAQIEAVRGVDCSGVLRSLLQRGLLEEVGRLDAPGRPVLYGVTDLFMHHFGLTALHELPPMDNADILRIEEAGA